MRIAVCRPQVPFVYGGAELVADQLVNELRLRGHEAELVVVPFTWYPGTRVLDQAFLWRPFKSSVNHRTYVSNVYHIGASTHPGPGLGGVSGFLLASSLR